MHLGDGGILTWDLVLFMGFIHYLHQIQTMFTNFTIKLFELCVEKVMDKEFPSFPNTFISNTFKLFLYV